MEIKLCKIPMIREQEPNSPQHQEAQSSLAVGRFTKLALCKVFYTQILKNAFEVFLTCCGWALHKTSFAQSLLYSDFKKYLGVFLTCCD
ncbi:hypothetical protein [Helicobacter pylori]|uniref:hypothetical protein n=1 Tax=Helicobacter pylori TaxID=210 RepID=UPI001BB40692|nr:hypothetical protein [Helicobacter pylori]